VSSVMRRIPEPSQAKRQEYRPHPEYYTSRMKRGTSRQSVAREQRHHAMSAGANRHRPDL
jgi:hypothetical protein